MARSGVDLWAIQLMGRWGSDTVKGYVREAQLETAARRAASTSSLDVGGLEAIIEGIVQKHLQGGSRPVAECLPEIATSSSSATSVLNLPALADEAQAALHPEPALCPGGAGDIEPRFVQNTLTEVVHRLISPSGAIMGEWLTACGWRVGKRGMTKLVPEADLPSLHKRMCEKCLPDRRASKKRLLAAAVQNQELVDSLGQQFGEPPV